MSSITMRTIRRALIAALALAAVGALLFVSITPSVEAPAGPTPADVQAARAVWAQIEQAQGERATRLFLDDKMIKGLAALASDAAQRTRFAGKIDGGKLSGEASIALPGPLWVNVSASTVGEHSGFPPVSFKVGRVSIPEVAGRWLADGIRQLLRYRGLDVPSLDDMVRHLRINERDVIAYLSLPAEGVIVDRVIATAGVSLNDRLVGDIYCQLADAQRARPTSDLSEVVRRTFGQAKSDVTEEYSRAAFVALSFHVAGNQAEELAPRAAKLTRKCQSFSQDIQLHRRTDLAKHWTFSAAFAAVLGEQAATSLGEWKELDDSGPTGSGFSFVDIAADRAGLRTALRVLDPASADSTSRKLGRATQADLLPITLLQAPEALSATHFEKRFGGVDQERYRRAVRSIDRTLSKPQAGIS